MEQPLIHPIPNDCDVMVIGSGPAGSACATRLASQGLDVLLVDQQVHPRDKICGDALIPDALSALRRLGLYDQVMQQAHQLHHLTLFGPHSGPLNIPASVAVMPRRLLDNMLCQAAVRAGARLLAPLKFVFPMVQDGRVVGAQLQDHQGQALQIRAKWLILATGAQPHPLQAVGLCLRREPSGIALRGYIRHAGLTSEITSMQFVCKKALGRGYGWIFPGPDDVFNVGVGLILDNLKTSKPDRPVQRNLHQLFQAFCDSHAPAAQLVREGDWVQPLRGAPLRCSLQGAEVARSGLLVTGEAVGSTYSLTGEGIGKALETGMLCADALLAGGRAVPDAATDLSVCTQYRASLQALSPRYEVYERANQIYTHPWLMDLLIWRARRSPRVLQHMSGLINETSDPARLFTWRGLRRLALG